MMASPSGERDPRRGGPGDRAEYVSKVGNAEGFQPYPLFPRDAAAYISGEIDQSEFNNRARRGAASSERAAPHWSFDV